MYNNIILLRVFQFVHHSKRTYIMAHSQYNSLDHPDSKPKSVAGLMFYRMKVINIV